MSRHIPSARIAPMLKRQLRTTYKITNFSISIALDYKPGASVILLNMQKPYEPT
jgi:hypothetical protein